MAFGEVLECDSATCECNETISNQIVYSALKYFSKNKTKNWWKHLSVANCQCVLNSILVNKIPS